MKLKLLDESFAIHRFGLLTKIPEKVFDEVFFNIVRTEEELSIVCRESLDLNSEHCDQGWACIKVSGPLDLNATGILSRLSKVLVDANISIFAVSTYDTDYILVKRGKITDAIEALKCNGCRFL